MFGIEFTNPHAVWWVVPAAAALILSIVADRRRRQLAERYADLRLVSRISRVPDGRSDRLRTLLRLAAVALIVVALAGPAVPKGRTAYQTGELDIMAVLDVSRSMAAEDVDPETSRLEAAKGFLLGLMNNLRGNRLGLVTYAREPFLQAPLTGDAKALRFVVRHWVQVESAPAGGSNVTAALEMARAQLRDEDRQGMLLLLSDGGFSSSEDATLPLRHMKQGGISIAVLGLGRPQGARIPMYDNEGAFLGWYRANGREVITSLDSRFLQRLAWGGGGSYYHFSPYLEPASFLSSAGRSQRPDPSRREAIGFIPLGVAFGLIFAERIAARLV